MLMQLLNDQSEANQAAIAAEARADAAEAALARGAARGAGPAANDDALIDPVVVAEAMERHLALLREMGELGMAMARMATRRALAEAPDAVADPGDAPGTGAADADMRAWRRMRPCRRGRRIGLTPCNRSSGGPPIGRTGG